MDTASLNPPWPDAELVFATTDATVAAVDAAGMLTVGAPGETLIIVTSPNATGSATFRLRVLTAGSINGFEVHNEARHELVDRRPTPMRVTAECVG